MFRKFGEMSMIDLELLIYVSILTIVAYLITIVGGAFFIGKFLKFFKFSQNEDSDHGLPRGGTMVGMLERAIVLTLGLLGEFGAISFVFVAKSMARFKQLENRQFAEYYLIGTLLSFFLALLVAIGVQGIFIIFLSKSS
jgi:hypothetical protein